MESIFFVPKLLDDDFTNAMIKVEKEDPNLLSRKQWIIRLWRSNSLHQEIKEMDQKSQRWWKLNLMFWLLLVFTVIEWHRWIQNRQLRLSQSLPYSSAWSTMLELARRKLSRAIINLLTSYLRQREFQLMILSTKSTGCPILVDFRFSYVHDIQSMRRSKLSIYAS